MSDAKIEAAKPAPYLSGDGAKTTIADDDFGLDQIATAIATLLATRIVADGYTIGIEGEWGSGKTSLTNFIIEDLKKRESLTLKVIRFEPWLVGRRQALLGDLFRGLRAKIEEFRTDSRLKDKLTNNNADLIDRLGVSLERYQFLLEIAGKGTAVAAKFDPTLHIGFAATIANFLSWLSQKVASVAKTKTAAKTQTLEQLRESIKGDLRTLAKLSPNTRFIVVIDDVDRLEPEESIEILRLIRAVADFPLVTYLVCYDRPHLAAQIKKMIGVGNGYDYLKKIFQNFVSLPPQEAFSLRRYARKLLVGRFAEEFSTSETARPGSSEREQFFFDFWCGHFVTTPRTAVRLAEAVTLGWPELKGKADFIDYVWLQLIKLECHDLYDWVRRYLVNIGAYRDGGRAGDDEPKQFALELRKVLTDAGWSLKRDSAQMDMFLPGVKYYILEDDPRVFDLDNEVLGRFEAERRLGSPSHWRLYFAFDKPSYALDDDVLAAFRAAATSDDKDKGMEIIRSLLAAPHAHKGYFLAVFLDRLFDARQSLDVRAQVGIAHVFGEVMDEVPPPTRLIGELADSWRRAESLLLPAAAPEFPGMCRDGAAINWLADVLRTQGFAHGRPGRTSSSLEPWLTQVQFDEALEALLSRIYALSMADLLQRPRPLTLLYLWEQLGDSELLHVRVDAFTQTDEGLLTFLDRLRTTVASSRRGVYRSLQSTNVQNFLDVEKTANRVRRIAEAPNEYEFGLKALELLDVWDWHQKSD
jgi:Cdc6-like AAA superfamily ATPase